MWAFLSRRKPVAYCVSMAKQRLHVSTASEPHRTARTLFRETSFSSSEICVKQLTKEIRDQRKRMK